MSIGDHTQHDSIAAIARHILHAAPKQFALCGLSMGGYVALEIMRLAPERVVRLALLDTMPGGDTPERSQGRRELVHLSQVHGLDRVMDHLLPLFLRKEACNDPALVSVVRQMARDTGVAAFACQQTAIIGRSDQRAVLATIAVPTLVLVGREDTLTPVAVHEDMSRQIPGSQLEIIENCGHLSTLEQPAAVTAALQRWLAC
jgi:pimeloyl-ACP methyl ester carboxylesterase